MIIENLYRARRGGVQDAQGQIVMAYPLSSGYNQNPLKPPSRANVPGLECLYCAESEVTAVAEMVIEPDSVASVCEFCTNLGWRL